MNEYAFATVAMGLLVLGLVVVAVAWAVMFLVVMRGAL